MFIVKKVSRKHLWYKGLIDDVFLILGAIYFAI